jgi:nitrite reductase (cytochrome c-552)
MSNQDRDRQYLFGVTRRAALLIGVAAAAAVASVAVTIGVAALLVNIMGHKQEAEHPFFRVVEVDDNTVDPAVWGKNFPLQYDMYRRTVDMTRTRYGGSEALPRAPAEEDPRTAVARSRLDEIPPLKIMWAGYAFAVDTREARGHAYMLEDQTYTERQRVVKQPGTCLHCHASTYTTYKQLGDGDIMRGFEAVNQMPYTEARKLVEHPVSCIDCHDPATMQLRITRPAFIEGIRALKNEQGIAAYDVNKDATRQEMRAFVCGQCHVEYYFKGPEKRLTFPWSHGLQADGALAYYEEVGFTDWTHAESGAKVLKAQHPEFEMWNQGIHARSGVACADCHMPYMRVGAQKVSDHHVRSPVLNINNACQTCHKFSEQELRDRVELIQSRTIQMRDRAMDALVALIGDIKAAKEAGATDEQLAAARDWQKRGQFLIDYVFSENSSGFHAPQETARLLVTAMDHMRSGELALR